MVLFNRTEPTREELIAAMRAINEDYERLLAAHERVSDLFEKLGARHERLRKRAKALLERLDQDSLERYKLRCELEGEKQS